MASEAVCNKDGSMMPRGWRERSRALGKTLLKKKHLSWVLVDNQELLDEAGGE